MIGSIQRKLICHRSVIAVMIFAIILQAVAFRWPSQANADEKQEELVAKGTAQYRQGDLAAAKELLKQAESVSSDNADVPYYLGLIYLEENQRREAIAEWQKYVRMASNGRDALKIRKYLTLLLREEAVAYAKEALAKEASLLSGTVADNTLAVTAFSTVGSEKLGQMGKGLAAMLISDLSQVPDLEVVERVRLQALLQEMNLGLSGVVDPATAPKVGKLIRSRHVATGSLADSVEDSLQILSAVVDTEKADRIDTREAKGALEEFFALEKKIACGIVEDIGRDCNEMPAVFNKIHTRSLPALISYSMGLDNFDREDYDKARELFQKAVDEDPGFDLAKEMLLWTPAAAMLFMTGSQMVSSISTEAGAVSSTGTAAAAGGGAATGAGAISTGWIVAGGVAGAAAVAAAASGGGGGGGGGSDGGGGADPSFVNIGGSWAGTWSGTNGASGAMSLAIVQNGDTISGSASIGGSQCELNGTLTGTVSESSLQGTLSGGGGSANLSANSTTSSMNGNIEFTSGECAGVTGNFSASITQDGVVSW